MESKNVRTLPKWQGTDGFRISVDELKGFILEEKYNRVCASKRVSCKTRIKRIVRPRAMWCLFWIHRRTKRQNRWNVTFQIVPKNTMNVKPHDLLLELIPFQSIRNHNQAKKWFFHKRSYIQLKPNLIEPLNKRIKEILAEGMKTTHQDTFVYFEWRCYHSIKADKTKKKLLPNRKKKKEAPVNGRHWRVLKVDSRKTEISYSH
jgi:hypothetical protein